MRHIPWAGTAFLVTLFLGAGPAFPAVAAQANSPQSSQNSQQSAQATNPDVESYLGTIEQKNGQYVLTAGMFTYKLTNQSEAQQFQGKRVQVIGKLNTKTDTIQVQNIQTFNPLFSPMNCKARFGSALT